MSLENFPVFYVKRRNVYYIDTGFGGITRLRHG